MQTMYLIVMTALGGLLSLFAAAGWSSYKDNKLPAISVLFRWFVTGILTSGLSGYAWLFGAGGDPSKLIEQIGSALEVNEVMEGLKSAVGGAAKEIVSTASDNTVGMPSF